MFDLLKRIFRLVGKKVDVMSFTKHKSIGNAEKIMQAELEHWSKAQSPRKFRLLDVGGGDGVNINSFLGRSASLFDIYLLDIENSGSERTIVLDITKPFPEQYRGFFDVIYSYNSLEHFCDPITASANIHGMLKEGGLCLIHTVFSWRYHPVPKDYYRFTDDALKYLFSERHGLKCIQCGYDISRRRENITGGYFEDKDIPPVDYLGGFRENWGVYFVGMKNDGSL